MEVYLAKKRASNPQPPRKMTKRQLSSYQKQLRRQRLIKWGGLIVIVAAILVISLGWLFGSYLPEHRTVLTVNGEKLDYQTYVATLSFYAESPDQVSMLQDLALDWMEEGELVRQAARELGITVSEDEINDLLASTGIAEEFTYQVESLLYQQNVYQQHILKQVPETAAQQHVYAMFLESEAQANEIRDRIIAGENFTTLAAAYSLETVSLEEKGDLGWHNTGLIEGEGFLNSAAVGEYLAGAETGVLSQPVPDSEQTKGLGYWLVKVVERNEELGVHVHGILCGSEAEALEVSNRISAGEDFADLAAEFTKNSVTDGDLGWLLETQMSPAYKDYVLNENYSLESLSYPLTDTGVFTRGGCWLLQLVDRAENRELSEADRNILATDLFAKWLEELKADPDNVIELSITSAMQMKAVNTVIEELTQ
jgi:SurA-like protein/PPIC-type peptidyl-prolyl cis-trans isomerase-like protein/parvulin-like peptidyl-prolyl cis-trans isomerase-like protein